MLSTLYVCYEAQIQVMYVTLRAALYIECHPESRPSPGSGLRNIMGARPGFALFPRHGWVLSRVLSELCESGRAFNRSPPAVPDF